MTEKADRAFGHALRKAMDARKMSLEDTGRLADVSWRTVMRATAGEHVDLSTKVALVRVFPDDLAEYLEEDGVKLA